MSCLPLNRSKCYTDSYAKNLYVRFAANLKKREPSSSPEFWTHANLVLLYLDKGDGSESMIFETFSAEALSVPMSYPNIAHIPLTTQNQRRRAANDLVREGRKSINYARELLAVIAEEITNRDNKTCLLLPCKNFGREIRTVFNCVRDVSVAGKGREEFKKILVRVSSLLPASREGRHKYFKGQHGLVFKSPGKAGARHGLAPGWEVSSHDPSCVIRGRMRFGASYDPKFHYDCDILNNGGRDFPSCHGTKSVPRNRTHVNIAPNDNIR